MLRSLSLGRAVDARPQFQSPDDVVRWVQDTSWLVRGRRAALLHLDHDRVLTCVATTWGRLSSIGPQSRDDLARDVLECGAPLVVAVDVRPRPATGPSAPERRRNDILRSELAAYAIVLLDTVVVGPTAGYSVTGGFPSVERDPGLPIHVVVRPRPPDERYDHVVVPFTPSLWRSDDEPD